MQDLAELKDKVTEAEVLLKAYPLVEVFKRMNDERRRVTQVLLTERFRKKCRKGKVWKSPAFLTALKNAEYGYDPKHSRSPGGYDGVFALDRDFRPANAMMKKLFDQFIDKPGSGIDEIAEALGVAKEELIPVRVVSHHMRLLGVMHQRKGVDIIALVDFDQ